MVPLKRQVSPSLAKVKVYIAEKMITREWHTVKFTLGPDWYRHAATEAESGLTLKSDR